jgi:Fe2+ or Zn2+ uptake regulation protein
MGRPDLLEGMRAKGLRLTPQRRVLAELLERADEHLDADGVLRRAQQRDPTIHRATVYRTLHRLKKLGLIDELDLMHVSGERHYYEVRPKAFHIHLVCVACKGVQEPSGPFWEDLKQKVERETGFKPEIVRLEMGGLCKRCRHRAEGPAQA